MVTKMEVKTNIKMKLMLMIIKIGLVQKWIIITLSENCSIQHNNVLEWVIVCMCVCAHPLDGFEMGNGIFFYFIYYLMCAYFRK